MRKFFVVGIMLVALFVLASASTAFGAPGLFCVQNAAFVKVSNKFATKAACEAMTPESATGEWALVLEWLVSGASVSAGAPVHVEQTTTDITLANLSLKITVLCAAADSLGIVFEEFDLTEEAVGLTCSTVEGSCGTPVEESVNLGWLTLLYEDLGEMIRDLILEDEGHGSPGYLIECFGVVDEVCTNPAASVLMENMLTEVPVDVLAIFDEGSTATCAGTGANTGEIKGEILISALEGLALELS